MAEVSKIIAESQVGSFKLNYDDTTLAWNSIEISNQSEQGEFTVEISAPSIMQSSISVKVLPKTVTNIPLPNSLKFAKDVNGLNRIFDDMVIKIKAPGY